MAKEVKNKNENKNKKHFFKDFKAELKKVIWPTPKQVANNTVAVITIVLITAVVVFVLDLAFEKLNTHGIDKIRTIVSSSETNDISTDNSIEYTIDATNTIESNTVEESNTISE